MRTGKKFNIEIEAEFVRLDFHVSKQAAGTSNERFSFGFRLSKANS
ncbi:MAG: hypothetical protein LBB48_01410 [Treponema sp.]|nr:hypothetical protein [Treponema sp.]